MRILQVNTEKGWRGSERQTLFALVGLRKQGIETELVALGGQPLAKQAAAEGFRVHEATGSLLSDARLLARLGKRFDVIHAQNSNGQAAVVLSRAFHKRPVVFTQREETAPSGLFSRMKYRRTDQVVAISPAIARILAPIVSHPVPVIGSAVRPHTPDVNRVRSWLEQKGFTVRKTVGVVAALVPHKDPLTAVRAASVLCRQNDEVSFLHFGTGPSESSVRTEIARQGLESRYHLAGFVERVEDFYWAFDVFLMSSSEEGLGSSVLDAFIQRIPVVSTDAGGLGDLVAEGRGLQCPSGHPEALAAALSEVFNDPEAAAVRADAAFNHTLAHHSEDVVSQAYVRLYRDLLA